MATMGVLGNGPASFRVDHAGRATRFGGLAAPPTVVPSLATS